MKLYIPRSVQKLTYIISQNWEANLSAIEAERKPPSRFDVVARHEATGSVGEGASESVTVMVGKGGKVKAGGKAL